MIRRILPHVVCTLVACLAVFALVRFTSDGALAQGGGGSDPCACVATIDLGRVLERMDERIDRERELQEFIAQLESEVNELRAQAETAQGDLEILVQGTPEFEEGQRAAIRAVARFRFEAEFAERRATERRKTMQLQLFDQIKAATAQFAEAEGYDLVMHDDSTEQLPPEITEQQASLAIASRRVIYSASGVDITDAVAQRMNNEYAARRGGAPR